jgi:hypothetical protein
MTAVAVQHTTQPAPNLPRVGILELNLPADGDPMRSVWIDHETLLVGYDPARFTRHLVELVLDEQLGAYVDIDAEEAQQ